MRIRILRPPGGLFASRLLNGEIPAPFTEVDAPDDVAIALFERGDAEPVREVAVKTTARRTGRPRKS